jgi:hypothetical protein
MIKIALIGMFLALFNHTARAQCQTQSYSSSEEPDYACPGPGESSLVPKVQLKTSVSLVTGDRAPWNGILLDKNRVLILGLRIKGLRRLRWLDVRMCRERCGASRKLSDAVRASEATLAASRIGRLKKLAERWRVEAESSSKWYKSGPLWFAVGVLTTTVAVFAVAALK